MAQVDHTHEGHDVNDPTPKQVNTSSKFTPGYKHFQTHRFGEYSPFFVMECVPKDRITLNSTHSVRSYTMVAPKMQAINLKKDYFNVPMESILPRNWEKIYTNPMTGEDVDDDVNCVVNGWNMQVASMNGYIYSQMETRLSDVGMLDNQEDVLALITDVLRLVVHYERFYSAGSLAKNLGYNWMNHFTAYEGSNEKSNSFDTWFEYLAGKIQEFFVNADYVNFTYTIGTDVALIDCEDRFEGAIDMHRLLELVRENPSGAIQATDPWTEEELTSVTGDISDIINAAWQHWSVVFNSQGTRPVNLARLWAYQLVCAHFYTNDAIDYVYSAQLYRDVIEEYCIKLGITDTFTQNGLEYRYDAMSGYYTQQVIGLNETVFTDDTVTRYFFQYWADLLGFKRSLRFMDYFTGCKSQPLAVGETDVNVSNNKVSIIDVTRNIQLQRYLNAVNRAGRKFSDYIKSIFGTLPGYDYHNPAYLAHTSDKIGADETQLTNDTVKTQANTVYTNMRSNAAQYAFEFEADRPSICIGICYYDFERVYKYITERQNFHANRFDMFNPYMQYIGDQEVYEEELNDRGNDSNFGYQLRHMEYKQRVSQASGGFIESLPAWIFEADDSQRGNTWDKNISPEYIRASNVELDKYFVSLTGYSLGRYFHFIVENVNNCDAYRPMAYAPSIL